MHFINTCACHIHSAFLYCMLDWTGLFRIASMPAAKQGAERSESWNQRKQQQLRCTEPEKAMGIARVVKCPILGILDITL